MQNGQLPTLREVVRHYSELAEDRLHAAGERGLKPLRLSRSEVDDLVAFLDSLTDSGRGYGGRPPPAASTCLSQALPK